MIISVSRRTDIPAFFSKWFFNRLLDGYVVAKNPYNQQLAHRISLKKEDVTCFIFYTKNPKPILDRIDELAGYHYYFHITLTSYGKDIELNVPNKHEIIDTMAKLATIIGKEKIIWRYDPIIISDKYSKEYHYKYFEILCNKLHQYTNKCVISFVDMYVNTKKNFALVNYHPISIDDMNEIAATFSNIAKKYNLIMETCSEEVDLDKYGIKHGKCVDDVLIGNIINNPNFKENKDKYQRKSCNCISCVDIGAYNCCDHRCLYCYANYSEDIINKNLLKHNPDSPLLIGEVDENVKIIDIKPKLII